MFDSLWIAKTGMEAQDFKVQVIANNMANSSTTGFKKDLAHFTDLSYNVIRGSDGAVENGTSFQRSLYVGSGVQVSETSKIFTQGDMRSTDSPLDLAIQGGGFFGVIKPAVGGGWTPVSDIQTDENLHFTRDGHFRLVPMTQGTSGPPWVLADKNGWAVADDVGNPIQLDPSPYRNSVIGTIEVRDDGTIWESDPSLGGPYQLTTNLTGSGSFVSNFLFGDVGGLIPVGKNNYQNDSRATGGVDAGQPNSPGHGHIEGGYLENSNVTVIDEMVEMIEAQRGYEMGSKVLEKADEMVSTLIQRT